MVVTADVPGAGSSLALQELPQAVRYRDIDPGILRSYCLEEAKGMGLLTHGYDEILADGRQLNLGELGALVHSSATDAAHLLRRRCLSSGENFIQQGTFAWGGMTEQTLSEFESSTWFEGFQILAVEIGLDKAQDQALDRWWDDRVTDRVHARYVPLNVIAGAYPEGAAYSSALSYAIALFNNPAVEDYSMAKLSVYDRRDETPVTLYYDRPTSRPVTIAGIESAVSQARGASHADRSRMSRVERVRDQNDMSRAASF